jgi:hypothetical protein
MQGSEPSMNAILQLGKRLSDRNLFLLIICWVLALLIAYSIITLRVNHIKAQLRKSGVEITHNFSSRVSLPLLEKNSQLIHNLLTDAANQANVVYASVVDHRNKVVAFTGTGHLMPDMTDAARSVEKVSMWEGGFASHARILNFASDIIYAGTKIGEIFIGLSTPKALHIRRQFTFVAIGSSLLLLFCIALLRYPSIKTRLGRYFDLKHSGTEDISSSKRTLVICPLCGTQKLLSTRLFKPSNLDKFLKNGILKLGSHHAQTLDATKIDLQELAKKKDFSSIRRQIILRCTEIIKKLANGSNRTT